MPIVVEYKKQSYDITTGECRNDRLVKRRCALIVRRKQHGLSYPLG